MLNIPSLHRHQSTPSTAPPQQHSTSPNHTTTTLSSGTTAHIHSPTSSPTGIIILQHGYAEYSSRYITSHHALIPRLLSANYAIYALDIWGHGDSPGTRCVAHIAKAVRDHLELRNLATKVGKPVILFGHSLGGLITAGSVAANGEGIQGVILTAPALPGPLPYVARLALGVAVRAMPSVSIPGRSVPITGLTRDVGELEKYYEDSMYHKKPICFLVAATALDVADTVRDGMQDWAVPTLVLHGDADLYCDWKVSEAFVQGIGSVDKEFGVYVDGRHELLHDLEGDVVLERVMEWIRMRV